MELQEQGGNVVITSDKREIVLSENSVTIDGMKIDFPGEYEKSDILVHVAEHSPHLLFSLRLDGRDVAYIASDELEITEEVADFFRDMDILVLKGTKNAVKLFENLEARMVVPYGEEKSVFLATLGQNVEATPKFKTKEADFDGEAVTFVNLG
jgi:hypothetical protein